MKKITPEKAEAKIEDARKKIRLLAEIQDEIYDNLVDSLGAEGRVEDFLFDFIFNQDGDRSFESYLLPFKVKYPWAKKISKKERLEINNWT